MEAIRYVLQFSNIGKMIEKNTEQGAPAGNFLEEFHCFLSLSMHREKNSAGLVYYFNRFDLHRVELVASHRRGSLTLLEKKHLPH